jgi:hypothetical protein
MFARSRLATTAEYIIQPEKYSVATCIIATDPQLIDYFVPVPWSLSYFEKFLCGQFTHAYDVKRHLLLWRNYVSYLD